MWRSSPSILTDQNRMNVGLEPAAWHDLGIGVLSASAALLGLFLVAMSLRLREIADDPILRSRATNTLAGLVNVLVTSLAILVPNQPLVWLGIELIGTNVIYSTVVVLRTSQAIRKGRARWAVSWTRLLLNVPIVGLAVASAVSLFAGSGPGLYLLLPGMFLVAPVATYNAWDVVFATERRARMAPRETR